jgi:hypothetical protein
MARKKSSGPIEQILEHHCALNRLESLVCLGRCDRDAVLVLLGNLSWAKKNKSWKSFAGIDETRDLTALARRITRLAAEIIVLNRTLMMTIYGRFMAGPGNRDLPALLIHYAAALKALPRLVGPRKHSLEEVTKCLLVAYIHFTTGDFHDEEVSALIGAVTDTDDYDEKAHARWRRSHSTAIKVALDALNPVQPPPPKPFRT